MKSVSVIIPNARGLAEGGAPNKEILDAIEKLGYTVAVSDVIAATGLQADSVEAEMAALLRLCNGFFEVNTKVEGGDEVETTFVASTFTTHNVRYVYPAGLRSLLKQRLFLVRMQEMGATVGRTAFALLRVSFGVILLLSLAIVLIVVIIVMIRGGGEGGRRGGGHLPVNVIGLVHRPRARHYGGGAGFDMRDLYFWWWWFQSNPFFFGQDYHAQQRWREQQERRRILAQLDEEEGAPGWAGSRRRSTSNSTGSGGRIQGRRGGGGGQEVDGEGEAEVDMSFLEAVFSLLFGDGCPGPSENERWQVIARLIHSHGGVVLPEEVLPLLAKVDPLDPNQSMLPVLERFGGIPLRCEGGLCYDFARMREGAVPPSIAMASTSSSIEEGGGDHEGGQGEEEHATLLEAGGEGGGSVSMPSTPPPTGVLEERRYTFSQAPLEKLQLAAGLGLVNLVGAIYVNDQWRLFTPPLRTLLYITGRALLIYAWAYLITPLCRLAVIARLNQQIDNRNAVRRLLLDDFNNQCGDPKSNVSKKLDFAYKYRKEVCGGGGNEMFLDGDGQPAVMSI